MVTGPGEERELEQHIGKRSEQGLALLTTRGGLSRASLCSGAPPPSQERCRRKSSFDRSSEQRWHITLVALWPNRPPEMTRCSMEP